MTDTPAAGRVDLDQLLTGMDPLLDDVTYVIVSAPPGTDGSALGPVATVVEDEGVTWIIDERHLDAATALGATPADPPPMARITLRVHSSLLAVGLTAAVSAALAAEGISCNVVAGYFHDHLFVPAGRGADAMAVLDALGTSSPD